MSKLKAKIELLVNIAIICSVIILGGALVVRYIWPAEEKAAIMPPDPRVPIGKNISLPDRAWSSERTVLVILSTRCRFCTESAPFYRHLATQVAERPDVKIVALFGEDINEGREYLRRLGVAIDDIQHVPLKQIDVMATPTLLVIDRHGRVTHSWVGSLAAKDENEVFALLQEGNVRQTQRVDRRKSILSAQDVQRIMRDGIRIAIIDLRERAEYSKSHIEGAVNIPFDELSVRATNELGVSDFIVVYSDCAGCVNDEKGRLASDILAGLGFRQTAALRGGIEEWAQASLNPREP